jgi:hypothetical protein
MGREGRRMMRCIKEVQTPWIQLRGQVAGFPGPDFIPPSYWLLRVLPHGDINDTRL